MGCIQFCGGQELALRWVTGQSCYHNDRKLRPEERNECKKTLTSPGPVRLKGLRYHCFSNKSSLFFNMRVIKQLLGDLTFSALWKFIYYKKYGNANVLFTRSVQRTKCIVVSHSKNVLTQRNVDSMSIVYLEFLWSLCIGSMENVEPK